MTLQNLDVPDDLPPLLSRELRGVRRHPSRSVRDDVKEMAGGEPADGRRVVRGRIGDLRHERTVAVARLAVTDRAERLIERATLVERSRAGGDGVLELTAGARRVL